MATFLSICQDFVREVGVGSGSGPSSVVNQRDELGRVVQFVRDAHLYICDLWPDWDFLWTEREQTTTVDQVTAGSTVTPIAPTSGGGGGTPAFLPNNVREYVKDSMQVKVGTAWQPVKYMEWPQFRVAFLVGSPKPASTRPSHWTYRPNRDIEFSHPIGGIYDFRFNYYRRAVDLADDSDEIEKEIPRRLVLARAKMIYAERENAPEIMAGAAMEYDDLLERLESNYCHGMAGGRGGEELSPDIS